MSSSGTARRLSAGARSLVLLLCVAAVLELLSFLALSAVRRQWSTWGRMQAARTATAAATPAGRRPQEAAPELPGFVGTEVIHPYLGFVLDRSSERCDAALGGYRDALDFGFACSSAPFLQHRSADTLIVGVFGGSVAYAFPAHGAPALARELRRSGVLGDREVVFVPLALPGFKQPQQLMTLAWFLSLGAEFDLVINLDGFNEVVLPAVENVPKGVFPLFPRSWYFRVGPLDPEVRKAMGRVYYLESRRTAHAELFSRPPLRYSATAALAWTVLDRFDSLVVRRQQARLVKAPAETAAFVARGPARIPADEGAMFAELAAAWRSGSLQMHRLCEGNGIRYFHFLQPNQYVPGSKPIGAAERRLALGDPYGFAAPVRSGYPLLQAAGRDLVGAGVRFHDLTRVFAAHDEPLYIDGCCHFSPSAYELVAAAMAQAIASDMAAGGATPRATAGAPEIRTGRR